MDSPTTNKPFPVTRYEHYNDFCNYYAYGNTPAEDFLQNAPGLKRPDILLLGCGDMRSCFYTIWKNFRKGVSNEVDGVHFVVNDYSSAIIARDILFIHLCLNMPQEVAAAKEWISALWAIWFCHELLPNHKTVLKNGLQKLIELSESQEMWSSSGNALNKLINFSLSATRKAVRLKWVMWNSEQVNVSVKQMKDDHLKLQKSNIPNISEFSAEMTSSINSITLKSIPHGTVQMMTAEVENYFQTGNAFAEGVLGIPKATCTTVNDTVFEHKDGKFTLHYASIPFQCFHHSTQFLSSEIQSMSTRPVKIRSNSISDHLLVEDSCFTLQPFLSNSVQQFAMWLTSCAATFREALSSSNGVSPITFTFNDSEALEYCLMLQSPQQYDLHKCNTTQFDLVYTSNLIDHLAPPNLVMTVLPLVKPGGHLSRLLLQQLNNTCKCFLD